MSEPRAQNPFAIRDFRLLWTGEAISALGDQFALIALPWLALVLTGSALALGGVLAVMAVPRALLMVVGGVSVDRFSPRRVMLGSNAVRLVAVTALGLVVLAGAAQLWMLYAFALVFGVADAFFFPAQTSIVPELVEPEQLQRANGITQGTTQGSVLIGPAVAGVVIAALGSGAAGATNDGIGIALLVDAATFMASLATLLLIRPRAHTVTAQPSILESLREGVRFVWRSPGLRAVMAISLSANLFIVGPFEVGMPFIAYSRLPEGAAAFGIVMAAFGGGALLGLVIASVLPAPRPSRLGLVVIGTLALAGLGVAALSLVHTTLLAAIVIGGSGAALGVGNLIGITWIQGRIPPDLMGRVMSLLITGSVGLVPVSMVVAGAAAQLSVDGTMLVAGCGMAALCLVSLLSPTVRNLGLEPALKPQAVASAATVANDPAGA
jgi:MFS family permease